VEAWFARWFGERVTVQVAESYGELEERLLGAEVDLAWVPPILCAKMEKDAHAILKIVRRGRSTYRSALVSRVENPLQVCTAALEGCRAAWVDPLSTGGYLLPRALLRRDGMDPDAILGSQVFLGSYRDALRAVILGEADLAPVYSAEETEDAAQVGLAECVGPERTLLQPFAFSAEAPNDGLVITSRLSELAADLLVKRLAPFATAPHGNNLLLAVLGAERFERASPGEYAAFSRIVRQV